MTFTDEDYWRVVAARNAALNRVEELEALFREEWRVVHMDTAYGHDRTSSEYPTRELAEMVRNGSGGRGGTLQRRLVAATEWEDID